MHWYDPGPSAKNQQSWYDETCTTTPQLYFNANGWCKLLRIYLWTENYGFVSDKSNRMRNKNTKSVNDIRNTIMIR